MCTVINAWSDPGSGSCLWHLPKKNICASKFCDRNTWEVQEQAGLELAQRHRGPTAPPRVPGAVGQAAQGAQQGKPWAEAAVEMQPRD